MIGCDVGDAEQVQGMIAKVLDDFGKVDILINNAGVGMRSPSSRPRSRPSKKSSGSTISARFTAPMSYCRR